MDEDDDDDDDDDDYAAISRRHSVSAPELSFFNEAIFITLRHTECFGHYECNGQSPSAD